MASTTTESPLVSHFNILSLYNVLWQQQDYSVLRQFKCNVPDLEEQEQVHPFNFNAIDLSQCPGAKLPNGATSMIIRSAYETFFYNVSLNERNIVIHGSAGIGKTYFLLYALVKRLLSRQPVTYQLNQSDSRVLCFTADGFFALPEENSEYHPLFQREDVLHLIDSTQEDTITHINTEHTRALMRGTCGKAIFTTFWPDNLDLDIEWLPEYNVVLRKWMKPCTFDEIFAMSTLILGQHEAKAKPLRWSYIHFGSNAHACLQASQHASDADYYLKELERAHDDLWKVQPALRESEARYSRNLFAVEPGKTCSEPLSFPVSQVAARVFAGEITSIDSAGAKETADTLLKSEDTKLAGEIFYRQAVVALMSRLGGIFTLGRPDVQGHYHPTQEELVLLTKMDVEHEKQQTMPSNSIYSSQRELSLLAANRPQILHTPEHALVHPGIDAIMFDADKLTVWLVQVMHGTSRPVSPEGLLFLLDVVRGSPYEPSPTHPWHFVYVTRGQPTKPFFHLSGQERTRRFLTQFWEERIKPYVMQLHDTDLDVRSSSNAYDQWGFPYKIPQRSSPSLPRRVANSLTHLVPRSRRTTESDITHDKMMSEIDAAIIRNSGVPGAQLLAEMVREQFSGPVRHHYVRDDKQTSSWRKRWAEVCR